jgi:hypothetical protein
VNVAEGRTPATETAGSSDDAWPEPQRIYRKMQPPKELHVLVRALRDPRLCWFDAAVLALIVYSENSPRPGAVSQHCMAKILNQDQASVSRSYQRLRAVGLLDLKNAAAARFQDCFQAPRGHARLARADAYVRVTPAELHEEGFKRGMLLAVLRDFEHAPQAHKMGEFIACPARGLERYYGYSERTWRRCISERLSLFIETIKRKGQATIVRIKDWREQQIAKREALRVERAESKRQRKARIREAQQAKKGAEAVAEAARAAAYAAQPEEKQLAEYTAGLAGILSKLKGKVVDDVVKANST